MTPRKQPMPPKAAKMPVEFRLHNDVRTDEYVWLQNKDDTGTQDHIRAENDYADRVMSGTKQLQKLIYKEIRKKIKENDMSVPVKDGPYYYYSRMQKGKQYSIHCRKMGEKGKEEIILDENTLARGKKFFSLGMLETSDDHSLLAYSVDFTGSEKYTLYIKDLRTGKLRPDVIDAVEEMVWCADSQQFFYTLGSHPHPPRHLHLHRLGEESTSDTLIYEEPDAQWYVRVSQSRSKKYIFISSSNFETREMWFVPSDNPRAKPTKFAERKKGVRYSVDHHKEHFYIHTNERATNFKIMRTPVENPERKHWRDWLPYDPERPISSFLVYEKFIAVCVRENASEEVYVYDPITTKGFRIDVPEREHSINLWGSMEFQGEYLRFSYSSFITPGTVYDFYPKTKKFVVRKKQEVPGWKPSKYVSKREWVKSGNVRVPVSMVYRKGTKRDGKSPLLLEGYGSYDMSLDPYFSVSKAALLERGWTIAFAHPRGGGELGGSWHKDGYLLKKHNTYKDFVAVGKFLSKKKYTSPQRLAIVGGSAGGMMIGAVLNLESNWCGAAIAYVPAADLLTTSLDESLGGTRLHYDETGDPRKPSHYFYMRKWSPYEAVRKAEYPALLVRANMNDIRTPYWEAAKWVARLRDMKTDANPLLLKTETVAGHFGKSGRYAWIKDRAFDFAFLVEAVQKKIDGQQPGAHNPK